MGYSVVTTVLAPAATYNLTDLPTAKVELSIGPADSSNDAWLTQAIAQVSASIQRHCKRVFAPEYVQDVFDIEQDPYPYQTPGGFAQLALSRWPVLAVVSVVQTLAAGATPTLQTLVLGRDFRVDAKTGRLQRLNQFTGTVTLWEAIPVTVTYSAGHGALVQETGAVPAEGPYQVTVSQAATFACDQQVSYASGAALVPVAANPAQGQYSVNPATGVYAFNAADAGQTLTFAYCTLNITADLVEICLKLITARFRGRARDPAMVEETTPDVGTRRWWFDTSQKGVFPPDIQDALEDYRVPTLA
jgi:hypothetical protein